MNYISKYHFFRGTHISNGQVNELKLLHYLQNHIRRETYVK